MDLPAFWNDKHQHRNTHWLTGSTLDMIYKFYDISEKDLRSRRILEIGVGVGVITKSLAALTQELYCADISNVALNNVRSLARSVFLTRDIGQAPSVDVALCHLVLVHCDDTEVTRLLSEINLSDSGKIYCQFSCLKTTDAIDKASPTVKSMLTQAGPHHFRDPIHVEKLINGCGLTISREKEIDPGKYINWDGQFWKLYELERKQK